ncbi:Homoserine dehydrogenase [Saezia sanguinis]|uniref:Homoserine dehydrogenase n=1 Tax=Saezia sanguinis TaxID=1965230 RepID=A0A433SAV5_9BURK|nr:homoserine dehydrogenase [Saezia sanguinis]RUS65878.1 Homoserine dehydrogenase [Saezia sanguinis]
MSDKEHRVLRLGLLGSGVVGSGVVNVLSRNQDEIRRRTGRTLKIVRIGTREVEKARQDFGDAYQYTTELDEITTAPDVDVVIELIGGTTRAREVILSAIAAGKHVVTANKALLAEHGTEIFAAARAKGVIVAFEAAIAGGIPIVKALREGLSANRIQWVAGIINGTTNYILSEMREKGVDFQSALKDAQALGYAEADPTFDIEGVDAAHKITLICSLAFGVPVQFHKAYIEGISQLETADIAYAEKLGYRVKLLGIAKAAEKGIELRVHPTLVPISRLIANVHGAMNAVVVQGDAVGATLYYGKGAGSEPTASAVIADLVDIARMETADPAHQVPYLAFMSDALSNTPILPMEEVVTSYYLRLRVADEAGVLAQVTRILADQAISIDAVIQRESDEVSDANENQTDLMILTHETTERAMNQAIALIESLPSVFGVRRIRKEELQ